MIKLEKKPPAPPQLKLEDVETIKRRIKDRIESGEEVPSKDFTPYWGNRYTSFALLAESFDQLEKRFLSELIADKLKAMEGTFFLRKKDFMEALEETLGADELSPEQLKDIVECATWTVPKILWEHQKHKCCYCERKLYWSREMDVEHFRPKAGVDEEPDHKGYWWLAYSWDNYLISCKICNSDYKNNRFPLLSDGKRACCEQDDLSLEKPVLLHPVDENPEEFIDYRWEGSNGHLVKAVAMDRHGRGKMTVNRLTGINHQTAMEKRAELLPHLKDVSKLLQLSIFLKNEEMVEKYAERIGKYTSSDSEFAGFQRAFFRKNGLSRFICADEKEQDV